MRASPSRTNVEEIVEGLLYGESSIGELEYLQLADISSDARLRNVYVTSGVENLREFLDLKERRFTIRNYGKISELKLRQALVSHFRRNRPVTKKQPPALDGERLIMRVLGSRRPWSVVSESQWKALRESLKTSELRHKHLYPVAARIGAYWPFSRKKNTNTDTVGKYLKYSIQDLKALRSFGRRKIGSYIACVLHLSSAEPNSPTRDQGNDLKSRILFAWENTKLTKKEKSVIEQRFGINTRKHTLKELGSVFRVTRERIRQIEKKAITKLKLAESMDSIAALLKGQRADIWMALAGPSPCIRKMCNLDQLEDNLPFEAHLAIELCVDRKHRGIKNPAVGDWLNENFRNDESNWYLDDLAGSQSALQADAHINPALENVMNHL